MPCLCLEELPLEERIELELAAAERLAARVERVLTRLHPAADFAAYSPKRTPRAVVTPLDNQADSLMTTVPLGASPSHHSEAAT